MEIRQLELSDWNDLLPDRGFDVFHTTEALRVIDRHSPGELHLFGGFKGEQPVGLFPIDVRSKLGGDILTSPPPGLGIGRLGPLIMYSSPKQRTQLRTNKTFIRGVLDELEGDSQLALVRMSCSPRYRDPRPFRWNGFDISPAFTYQLDLADADTDQLLQSFTRDFRSEIRKQDGVDFSIRRGGMNAARETFESITERIREQDYRTPLPWEFVRDLLEELGDRARVYVAEADGRFLSGMIILYSNDTAYFWKGGAKTERTVSPNSLLHWRVIEDILTDPELASVDQYDLYTANDDRLAEYKSKFGGKLSVYYVVESKGLTTTLAKSLYRMSAFGRNPLQAKTQI